VDKFVFIKIQNILKTPKIPFKNRFTIQQQQQFIIKTQHLTVYIVNNKGEKDMHLTALWICLGVIGGMYIVPIIIFYPFGIKADVGNLSRNGKFMKIFDIIDNSKLKIISYIGFFTLLSLLVPIGMAPVDTMVRDRNTWVESTSNFASQHGFWFVVICIVFVALIAVGYIFAYLAANDSTDSPFNFSNYICWGLGMLFFNFLRFASPLAFVTLIIYKKYNKKGKENIKAKAEEERVKKDIEYEKERIKRDREREEERIKRDKAAEKARWRTQGLCEECGGELIKYSGYRYNKCCSVCDTPAARWGTEGICDKCGGTARTSIERDSYVASTDYRRIGDSFIVEAREKRAYRQRFFNTCTVCFAESVYKTIDNGRTFVFDENGRAIELEN